MNRYKAGFFDLDSTLVYTTARYRKRVVGNVLNSLGITKYPDWFIDKFWFFGDRAQTIRDALLGIDPELVFKNYQEHDTEKGRRKNTRVFDDVEFLDELRKDGYKIGVVTGGSPHVMNVNVDLIGRHRFDALVSANLYAMPPLPPKPDPTGLYLCLEQLGVRPEEAFFVGNGEEDVGVAQSAGVLDILILRGEHEPPKVDATHRITTLYELRDILRG